MALECRCGHGSSSLKSSMVTVPQRHDRSQRRDIAPPHRAETRSLANQSSPFPFHLSLVPCRLSRCHSSPVTSHWSLALPSRLVERAEFLGGEGAGGRPEDWRGMGRTVGS